MPNFEQQKTVTDGLTSGLYSDQFSKEIMDGVGELGALSANSQEYSKKLATLTGNLKYKVDRQAQNTEAWKTQDAALGSEGVGKGYYDDVKKIEDAVNAKDWNTAFEAATEFSTSCINCHTAYKDKVKYLMD